MDVPEDDVSVHGNAEQEKPIRSTHKYRIRNHQVRNRS